jgi:hypothetical protein
VGGGFQRAFDNPYYCLGLGQHFMIPESQHPKRLCIEPFRPFSIIFDMGHVVSAIQFDD